MSLYNINGDVLVTSYDDTIFSVNHRGYSAIAPENTLPAYRLSKRMGFNYVETDVSFTSDGVAMLLHDSTIDRTSNGSGTLSNMTYSQVRQYDFGSWKSAEYAGTVIPTLAEFLALCKDIMLHPWIELKDNGGYTQAQIEGIVDMVNDYGMTELTSYISFSSTYLGYVKDYNSKASLGFLKSTASSSDLSTCQGLQTTDNLVFYAPKYSTLSTSIVNTYKAANIPIRVWTVNNSADILAMDPYVSGVTSDNLIAGKVLYDANISD